MKPTFKGWLKQVINRGCVVDVVVVFNVVFVVIIVAVAVVVVDPRNHYLKFG